jgi:hypothetical protein
MIVLALIEGQEDAPKEVRSILVRDGDDAVNSESFRAATSISPAQLRKAAAGRHRDTAILPSPRKSSPIPAIRSQKAGLSHPRLRRATIGLSSAASVAHCGPAPGPTICIGSTAYCGRGRAQLPRVGCSRSAAPAWKRLSPPCCWSLPVSPFLRASYSKLAPESAVSRIYPIEIGEPVRCSTVLIPAGHWLDGVVSIRRPLRMRFLARPPVSVT